MDNNKHTITITSENQYTVDCTAHCCTGVTTNNWCVVVKTVQELIEALMFDHDGENISIVYE